MPDHAGFAAAVTVHERVLNVALLAAYANGSFPKVLAADLPGGSPGVNTNLFLGQPTINCEGATNLLVLTIAAWGSLTISIDDNVFVVQINGEIEVSIPPVFQTGSSLKLSPPADQILIRNWAVSVTSADSPADVVSYVTGDQFRTRFQTAIQFAIALERISLPSIDVSFFGTLATLATSVEARVRNGLLLIGLNVQDEINDEEISIVGDVDALADFARSNDIAGVVNAVATKLLLNDLYIQMDTAIEDADATFSNFSVSPQAGYFLVTGRASKSSGTINFSFHVVPSMFHTRPGKFFRFLPKERWVNGRTWAALDFRVEAVETDVDRSWWVIVLDVVGALIGGTLTFYIEALVTAAGDNFSGRVKAAKPGAPAARIRRTIPPPGGVAVRIGVDQFEISSAGTYTGISIRETSAPAILLGPTVVPRTYFGDDLRYQLQLPSVLSAADPALHIHWTLEDRTNDLVLADEDGLAAGRLRFGFQPAGHANARDFRIVARLYRRLGSNLTELGITSLNVHIRGLLPPAAYIRWRSEVTNPQIIVDEKNDTWNYRGESRVRRWSEWHRTDAPCRAVNAPNRYRYEYETVARLPFPLRLLENHRKGLCPYCFYGGPGGINPSL